ncbi:MAG: phosphoglycolate phosphatase [Halobacteriota archaeon]|nr:phosphoglycolate phosphatase [Halobacteriota archaeon]
MRNISALAIDIDGTITYDDRRLDLEAIKSLRDLEGIGIPVILSSGNILCFMNAASIMIGTSGPLIAENGGIVEVDDVVHYMGNFENVERFYNLLSSKYDLRKVKRSELRKTEIAMFRDIDIEVLREELDDEYGVDLVDSNFAIHIIDRNVNKGNALKFTAELIGIPLEEIAAVGDSENDYEMIKCAGIGICIGDGMLSEVSDYVTKNRFGKGAVEAIDYLKSEGYIEFPGRT